MTWTETERAAVEQAAAMDSELTRLAEEGLTLVARAIDLHAPAPPALLVGIQARVLTYNTLRASWALLFLGYEVQALALARLITEYLVLCWYVDAQPDAAGVWLQTDAPPPSVGEMLAALEREQHELPYLAPLVAMTRSLLHRFAHQDPYGFSFTYRDQGDVSSFTRTAPRLDAFSLRRGGEFLMPLLALAVETVARDAVLREEPAQRAIAGFRDSADAWFSLEVS